MDPASQRYCAQHPRERAVDVCGRCGAFACMGCVESVAGTVCCARCLPRLTERKPQPVPQRVYVALLLAVAGCLFPLFGLVGAGLGWRELRRIRRAEAPEEGQWVAALAKNVGLISPVLWLVGFFYLMSA